MEYTERNHYKMKVIQRMKDNNVQRMSMSMNTDIFELILSQSLMHFCISIAKSNAIHFMEQKKGFSKQH